MYSNLKLSTTRRVFMFYTHLLFRILKKKNHKTSNVTYVLCIYYLTSVVENFRFKIIFPNNNTI